MEHVTISRSTYDEMVEKIRLLTKNESDAILELNNQIDELMKGKIKKIIESRSDFYYSCETFFVEEGSEIIRLVDELKEIKEKNIKDKKDAIGKIMNRNLFQRIINKPWRTQ